VSSVASPDDELARIYRRELPLLRAALARRTGSVDLADDLVQDAWVEALDHWARAGVPANPGGWLMTTATRKAVDRARRERSGADKLRLVAAIEPERASADRGIDRGVDRDEERLALVFGCCDPRLPRDSQVALTLRAVCGLTTTEIAAGFLIPEATMAQRISRAKRLLRESGTTCVLPGPDELGPRLSAVLTVVYLVYNEGYLSSSAHVPQRRELRLEALELARLVDRLMPTEPEAAALHCLLELHEARSAARFDGWGRLVLLADQDRGRWDDGRIARATDALDRALARRRPGPFQVHAAIAALHATSASYDQTDWPQIGVLYDRLLSWDDTPVLRLNRAIATWHVHGAASALAEVDALAPALASYRLWHATRAALLRDLGHDDEARAADQRALELATNTAERELLRTRVTR
jgi:RNA polymerase sigma factor (sigma-70 family)